jgi:hypothetical protein
MLAKKLFKDKKNKKSFVYFDIFWQKSGQVNWHLQFKTFMFLETVNKNKQGNLSFKEIENTCRYFYEPYGSI